MNFKSLQFLIFLLSHTLSLRVFHFNEANGDENLSTITLTNPVQIGKKFTICSSHRQFQLTLNSGNVYTLYEDQDLKKPWFAIGFWNEANLWVTMNKTNWYFYGTYPFHIIKNWIHVCFEIDVESKVIKGSVNGGPIHICTNVTALSDIPPLLYIGYEMNLLRLSSS